MMTSYLLAPSNAETVNYLGLIVHRIPTGVKYHCASFKLLKFFHFKYPVASLWVYFSAPVQLHVQFENLRQIIQNNIQLILEQSRYELCRSTYTQIFSVVNTTVLILVSGWLNHRWVGNMDGKLTINYMWLIPAPLGSRLNCSLKCRSLTTAWISLSSSAQESHQIKVWCVFAS